MKTTIEDMMLWYEMYRLQERYVSVIDTDLEEWPDLFTENCVYEVVPTENADFGLAIGIMHCFGRAMLRDRITSLRKANVFEPHTYRHMTSGLEFAQVDSKPTLVRQQLVGQRRSEQPAPWHRFPK